MVSGTGSVVTPTGEDVGVDELLQKCVFQHFQGQKCQKRPLASRRKKSPSSRTRAPESVEFPPSGDSSQSIIGHEWREARASGGRLVQDDKEKNEESGGLFAASMRYLENGRCELLESRETCDVRCLLRWRMFAISVVGLLPTAIRSPQDHALLFKVLT